MQPQPDEDEMRTRSVRSKLWILQLCPKEGETRAPNALSEDNKDLSFLSWFRPSLPTQFWTILEYFKAYSTMNQIFETHVYIMQEIIIQ